MCTLTSILAIALIGPVYAAAQAPVGVERRQRAATALRDGILLLHAKSTLDFDADGFRQEPSFYYFTGLENTVGAVLAIDGKTGESFFFCCHREVRQRGGLALEAQPGAEAAKLLGFEHVVDWSEMEPFFSGRAAQASVLYFANAEFKSPELPSDLPSKPEMEKRVRRPRKLAVRAALDDTPQPNSSQKQQKQA